MSRSGQPACSGRLADSGNRWDSSLIYGLFRDLDLFRWTSRGSEGRDWTLRPRLTLEANLICARRLGDAQAEAKVLVDLIGSALHVNDDGGEREFLLNLLSENRSGRFQGQPIQAVLH